MKILTFPFLVPILCYLYCSTFPFTLYLFNPTFIVSKLVYFLFSCGLCDVSGSGDQHHPTCSAEDAVSQNKNRRYQRFAFRSHPTHSQQRVNVIPFQKCHS